MAITFDTGGTGSGSSTSLTLSATVNSNTNGILIVTIMNVADTSNLITDITYAGVSFFSNLIDTQINTGYGGRSWTYYLLAPATGTNNLIISESSARSFFVAWESYTGVSQSAPIDAHTPSFAGPITGAADVPDTSVTPVSSNCWAISCMLISSTTHSAGTGTTQRQASASYEVAIGDSNGTVAAGSAYHLKWNTSAAGTYWSSCAIALAPDTGGGTTTTPTPQLALIGVG